MNQLVAEALCDNHDIRIATARLREARALLSFTEFDRYPTVTTRESYERQRLSKAAARGADRDTSSTLSALTPVGSWISLGGYVVLSKPAPPTWGPPKPRVAMCSSVSWPRSPATTLTCAGPKSTRGGAPEC